MSGAGEASQVIPPSDDNDKIDAERIEKKSLCFSMGEKKMKSEKRGILYNKSTQVDTEFFFIRKMQKKGYSVDIRKAGAGERERES